MPDHAVSADPAVQAQLDRLWSLSPGADILGLERITQLLALVGDPHLRLPPVFHVAGTNGKGSTCAFLRAALEASGRRVHCYTSPHLVRFNERIRLAGRLIDDAALAPLLAEVLDAAEREAVGASFFEVTTAAAFLAFARMPADACVIEVGLGGRLDATNVLTAPVACGIAALGIDHEAFLGDTLAAIAGEKAGIAKPGAPLVTMAYGEEIDALIAAAADSAGARLAMVGRDWRYVIGDRLQYADARGELDLPLPTLAGPHQAANLALAAAMLRHQQAVAVSDSALANAALATRWPARMQRLADGPLVRRAPAGAQVWLDGGHNPSAGLAISRALPSGRIAVILGMLANKDAAGLLAPIAPRVDALVAVPIPGHAHHDPAALAAAAQVLGIPATATADSPAAALDRLAALAPTVDAILIAGSLYLAGLALDANDERPE